MIDDFPSMCSMWKHLNTSVQKPQHFLLFCKLAIYYYITYYISVEGDGGQEPGRIGAGGVREVGGERMGSRIPKVVGTGRREENFAILRNILQST